MFGGGGAWGMARRAFNNAVRALPRPRFRRYGETSNRGEPERLVDERPVPRVSRRSRQRAERRRQVPARLAFWAVILAAGVFLYMLLSGSL
ncbi:MAG: hypothetical protein ACYTDY_10935 [Planctomycetota bacterium]|jgi:hypothetical protein